MERTKVTEVQALADTGASLTVITEELAEELEPGENFTLSLRGRFTLPRRERIKVRVKTLLKQSQISAGKIELNRSSARISIDGKEAVQNVLVSDFIDSAVLGVVNLRNPGSVLRPLELTSSKKKCCFIDPKPGEVDFRRELS